MIGFPKNTWPVRSTSSGGEHMKSSYASTDARPCTDAISGQLGCHVTLLRTFYHSRTRPRLNSTPHRSSQTGLSLPSSLVSSPIPAPHLVLPLDPHFVPPARYLAGPHPIPYVVSHLVPQLDTSLGPQLIRPHLVSHVAPHIFPPQLVSARIHSSLTGRAAAPGPRCHSPSLALSTAYTMAVGGNVEMGTLITLKSGSRCCWSFWWLLRHDFTFCCRSTGSWGKGGVRIQCVQMAR